MFKSLEWPSSETNTLLFMFRVFGERCGINNYVCTATVVAH